MVSLKKLGTNAIFWAFLLIFVYALTRLTNLTKLPIFTDEAIYIRWSQIGSRDANWRFISLTDGKQPLFTWVMMVLLKFIDDPLLAGRLVSVLAGVGSMIGIWLLTYELFHNKRIAVLACILYLVSPFSLMYDRMALYDSLVSTFSILNLYLGILLVRHLRLDIALILGMSLGAGMLNKTSGFLSLYLLPITLLLFDWGGNQRKRRLAKWLGLVIIATCVSQAMYMVLRLSPFFHMVVQKDAVFVYPFEEWIQHPTKFFIGNIKGLFDWLWHYLTAPIILASIAPLLIYRTFIREKLILYGWSILPVVGLALFARILYPRFILFMTMPLLIAAALGVNWMYTRLRSSIGGLILLFLLLIPSFYIDYFIIVNPIYASIPQSDKAQFVDDWPSGWGIQEINAYLLERSFNNKVSVYTDGTFGLLPAAIEIYLVDKANIDIHGIWPLPKTMPIEMLNSARRNETYLVLNQAQVPPEGWSLRFVAQYQKGNRKDRSMRLYQVILPITP